MSCKQTKAIETKNEIQTENKLISDIYVRISLTLLGIIAFTQLSFANGPLSAQIITWLTIAYGFAMFLISHEAKIEHLKKLKTFSTLILLILFFFFVSGAILDYSAFSLQKGESDFLSRVNSRSTLFSVVLLTAAVSLFVLFIGHAILFGINRVYARTLLPFLRNALLMRTDKEKERTKMKIWNVVVSLGLFAFLLLCGWFAKGIIDKNNAQDAPYFIGVLAGVISGAGILIVQEIKKQLSLD